jgi:hypothetical protein
MNYVGRRIWIVPSFCEVKRLTVTKLHVRGIHGKSVKKGRRRPDARAYRDDLFRKSRPPLYAPLRSLWEASHMARWTDLFPACDNKKIRVLRLGAPAESASYL